MNPKKKPVPSLVQASVTPVCDLESSVPPMDRGFKHAAMTHASPLRLFTLHSSFFHLRHLRITPPHLDPLPKDPLPGGAAVPNSPSVPTHAPLVHALPDSAPPPPA